MREPIPGSVIPEGYDLALAKRSVGVGWHGILEGLFSAKPEGVKVIQVKEKFGGLRFYLDDGTVRVDLIGKASFEVPVGKDQSTEYPSKALMDFKHLVRQAERESFSVCEDCGAPGHQRSGRWVRTLCDACYRP